MFTTHHFVIPFMIILTALVLIGCDDSSTTFQPPSTDELREQGQGYQLALILALERTHIPGYAFTRVSCQQSRYSGAAPTGIPLEYAQINDRVASPAPGQSSTSFSWLDLATEPIPVRTELPTGYSFQTEITPLEPPTLAATGDTLFLDDELHLHLSDLGGFERVYLRVDLTIDDVSLNWRTEVTAPIDTTLPIQGTLHNGYLWFEAMSLSPHYLQQDVIADTVYDITVAHRYDRTVILLPASD